MGLGMLHQVSNQLPENAASSEYWRVLVKSSDGFETLLFTPNELKRCRDRASKNQEDLMIPNLLDKIRAFFAF